MKIVSTAMFASLAALSPAAAQTTPPTQPTAVRVPVPVAPAVGVTVVDTAGAPVGRIESINGGLATIDTGTNKVPFPLTSMTAAPDGPIIAMTKAQLDASFVETQAKAKAELQARLVAGTPVFAVDGTTQLGTIKAVDAGFVTIGATRDERIPVAAFALGQTGVVTGVTPEAFKAAAGERAASRANMAVETIFIVGSRWFMGSSV